MSQGQFGHFMCHLTVLEAEDDGKVRLENETSSEAKWVRNFISGPSKKDNFKLRPNKKFSLIFLLSLGQYLFLFYSCRIVVCSPIWTRTIFLDGICNWYSSLATGRSTTESITI